MDRNILNNSAIDDWISGFALKYYGAMPRLIEA